jgi:glycerol-3-phosphate acyltransferase PlsY
MGKITAALRKGNPDSMKIKMLCILIGYLCGCFLTADVVARRKTGKSIFEMGTKNPGTANVTNSLGVKCGAITLLGDAGKTVLACVLCRHILFPSLGKVAVLYAGVGAALGHGFPFWHKFRGGRSVAVTCSYIIFFLPLWGIAVNLAGLVIRIATKYPASGALAIPSLFILPVFLTAGAEAGFVMAVGTAVTFILHRDSLFRMAHGTEPKSNLIEEWKQKL